MKSCSHLVQGSRSFSPQRSVSLDLDDVQGVEVGDKQVGLSVGCTKEQRTIHTDVKM